LEGEFPLEVTALVEELNGLLAQQARSIERARAQAGDLAHRLKTSLQVLLIEAANLVGSDRDSAPAIREQAARMRHVIDRHLVRARAQGRLHLAGARVEVGSSVAALALVLGAMAATRGVVIQDLAAGGHSFAGSRESRGDLAQSAGQYLQVG
jgi:signal transduction histidine kinase